MYNFTIRAIYVIGGLTKHQNAAIAALAMMEQNGTEFIKLDESGFKEFERLTGFEEGASDFYLYDFTEKGWLVWNEKPIAYLNWDKIMEELK
jgi:hypothetical protein